MTFQELGLNAPILRALADLGYQRPSPIQAQAIPPALAGRDVLGCAQTGTGKTCAFAAPILQRLSAAPVAGRPIRSLVLTPTRELALQIHESFEAYGKNLPLRCAVIFGGVGQTPQVERLKRGVDILVATPGRLGDLYGQGFVDLSRLETFVLDEADRMLDMGFIHDVKRILTWLPKRKQTLFFSATMPPEVQGLVDSLLHQPVRVAVDPVSSPVESIEQRLYYVDRGNKTKLLSRLIQELHVKNALVFTRTKHGANKVAADLVKAGISAAAIHGNKSQTARQQALSDFKSGAIQVLVATDIAARGLDIEELSHVFNYNLPDVPETYVHRIGRTGRAGRGGAAVSFCDANEQEYRKAIEKLIGRPVPVVAEHPWPMEILEPAPKDRQGRTVNPEDAEARAAAKERRRAQNAASKPAGEPKVQAEPAPSAPEKKLSPRQRKPRGYRASATLEEALAATAPRRQEPEVYDDFQRPDPLASDVIMDATARLLAPRTGPAASSARRTREPKPAKGAKPSKGTKPAQEAKSPKSTKAPKGTRPVQEAKLPKEPKPAKAPKTARAPKSAPSVLRSLSGRGGKRPPARSRGGRSGRPPEITLRSSAQKDSTEQPSLMKPYYLHDD